MARFRKLTGSLLVFTLVITLLFASLISTEPVNANVTAISLFRRSCGSVNAYANYDGFSEGTIYYYVVFAVDLNNNGVYSEAGEPVKYIRLAPGGPAFVGANLRFKAVPEGSTISVTAYEIDSAGVKVSPQLPPVSYQCTHRPATDRLPSNDGSGAAIGIVAKVSVPALIVYSEPSARSARLGGVGLGQFLNVTARNRRGDWFQVEFQGKLGWIMWVKNVIPLGPYTELPILPNAEQYTPTPLPPTPIP
jgi:hypothetical protein